MNTGAKNNTTKGPHSMSVHLMRLVNDQSAATAIEYGLIAAGIVVAIIVVVQALGKNLNATFSSVSTALK